MNDFENDPDFIKFMAAIEHRIDKTVAARLEVFLFYFKESMKDIRLDIASIRHE